MHIPDGFLDPRTAMTTGVLAATGLGVALRQVRRSLPPRRVPLLGLSAAFVFAAQMLNFPVIGGTSGHWIGGVLTAVLLGPSAAVIVLSTVLTVQCFLFADGGITALGANIFNMAIVGGVGGWAIYRLVGRLSNGPSGRLFAAMVAGWAGTVLASIACAGELATSHTIEWPVVFPTMVGIHILIGIGEGLITTLVLAAIAQARPDLLGVAVPGPAAPEPYEPSRPSASPAGPPWTASVSWERERPGAMIMFGLLISLGLALFVAPLACPWPDGLDKAAEKLGFKDKASEAVAVRPLLPDYKVPNMRSPIVATSVAGAAGTVFVFGLAWALARALAPKPNTRPPSGTTAPRESPG